jgi:hypothetical protein
VKNTTVQTTETLKSPHFVLELIALSAVNILAVISGQYETAVIIDAAICGYHIGMQ